MKYITVITTFIAYAATSFAAVQRQDACATACSDAYNTCQSQSDANRAACASDYATCLGYSPYGSDGSLDTPTACSITTDTATATPIVCNAAAISRGDCLATAASVHGSTFHFCNATAVDGGNCTGTAASASVVYTTMVYTELTTYCPEATTLTFNEQTYTISSATTLTVTNCPCTVVESIPTTTPITATATPEATPDVTPDVTPEVTPDVTPTTTSQVLVTAAAGAIRPAVGLLALGAAVLL
ncbi:hypothetical protein SCAR479_10470 [Seiridium cardinale]|uniref:Uncharacterized protein n=1 Tax=Seiridium cardinale TaxID=138064 RepID=A0ABR2XG35_9PEZI